MTERRDFTIRWTLGSAGDFEKILDYIEMDRPLAALKFGERLLHHIEQLGKFPLSCPRSQSQPSVHESVFESHVIYYAVGKNEIVIKAVVHGARQFLAKWLRRR